MSKPFNTEKFKKLNESWQTKLKENGFEDIEDSKGRLKQYDRRTQAWENRDSVEEYYNLLGDYLNKMDDLQRLDRKILESHLDGLKYETIAFEVYRSVAHVKNTIHKHRKIILHKS